MSLPQLIGLQCVICQKGIASVVDGMFCEECGNPHHPRCAGAAPPAGAEKCPQCGGDPACALAKEVRRERGCAKQAELRSRAAGLHGMPIAFPVSAVCPQCGNKEYRRQRPQGWVAFAWDRVCIECGTIYSPPTPLWAAIVFLLAGVLLTGFGGLGVLFAILSQNPVASLPGLICQGIFAVVGILALVHGIRSLSQPGKV